MFFKSGQSVLQRLVERGQSVFQVWSKCPSAFGRTWSQSSSKSGRTWSNCFSSLVERGQNCSSSLVGRGQCVLQSLVERVGQSVLGSSGKTAIPTGQTVAKCSPLILPPSDKGRLLEHCHWQDIGEAGVLGRQWPPLAKLVFLEDNGLHWRSWCSWKTMASIGEAGVLGRQWPPLAKPAFWKHTEASA